MNSILVYSCQCNFYFFRRNTNADFSTSVSYKYYLWDNCANILVIDSAKLVDMLRLETAINWSGIQKEEHAYWQVRKFDGVCTLQDSVWLRSGSTVNFSQDLVNVTKKVASALIFTTLPRLQSAQNFLTVYVLTQAAN